jgi:glycosyltransferase involved in cell wall biosynthesis
MSLRVAYVVKMFPRLSETFILNEILELERRGVEVVVHSLKRPAPGPVHPGVRELRARIHYLPERPVEWLSRGLVDALRFCARRPREAARMLGYVATRRTHQAWKRFFQAASLARDAARRPVDHVHAHFASAPARVAMFAARMIDRPFSFTAHAKDIYNDGTDLDLLRDKMRAARFVVTVSDFNRAYLSRIYGPDANGSLRRLYNGVDLNVFAPRPANTSRDVEGIGEHAPSPAPILLAVGRLVEKKGFDDLLGALPFVLEHAPRARLVIVGAGPEEARLRTLASELGVARSVTWVGALPHDEVRTWLSRATLFCLPCRVAADGNRDGLPTVLLEALACGVPCVTTALTGIPEIVRDGVEGRLVAPGDAAALADAIGALLADREARSRMARAARIRAGEQFDLRANVGRLASWFEGARLEGSAR